VYPVSAISRDCVSDYDLCIRFKITPVTIPPKHPRLSHNGRSCNAIPTAAPTPAPIATDGPSLFFRSAIICDRLYSAPTLPGRLLLFPGHRKTLGFSAAGRAFPDVISTFGVSHTLTDCITCHAAARGRGKEMSPVPSCFIFRYPRYCSRFCVSGFICPSNAAGAAATHFRFSIIIPSLCFGGAGKPVGAL